MFWRRKMVAATAVVMLVGFVMVLWPTDSPASIEPVEEESTVAVRYTSQEAQAAGQRLSRLPQQLFFGDAAEVKTLLVEASTAEYFDAFEATLLPELAEVRRAMAAAEPASTWWVTVPLSIEVTNTVADGDLMSADVQVWTVEMFSRDGVTDPELAFSLIDMSLSSVGPQPDWRISAWSKGPGPAARLGADASPSTAKELDELLNGHGLVPVPTKEGL